MLPAQERARALFARGVTLDSLGRLDEARRNYLAALKGGSPNPQYPYFGLGQIAEAEGDLDAARGYYNKALAAFPGFPLALERLIALGAPTEGAAGLPADTGIIVLQSPSQAAVETRAEPDAAVALHPLERKPAIAAARRLAPPPPVSGWGAPLRPTILDGPQGRGGALAQLGAWRSEQEARDSWAVARDNAGGLLDGLTPVILRAEVAGRGVNYRLRTAPRQAVAQFCAQLVEKGQACIPVRD